MTNYVPRVVALDALILDDEFFSLIKNQIFNILNAFKIGGLSQKYGPELGFLIKLVIWKVGINARDASLGQSLLGIKYSCDNKWSLKLQFLFQSLIPYFVERCFPLLRHQLFLRKVEKPLVYFEDFVKMCEILNFLIFLNQNRYPTLLNRMLKLKMIPAFEAVHPSVGYSYQLREMLWHQFANFLMVVLPIVNFHRMKRYLRQWGFKSVSAISAPRGNGGDSDTVSKCCLCKEDAVIPQQVGSCAFCYYCLKANTVADPDFRCTTCVHVPG